MNGLNVLENALELRSSFSNHHFIRVVGGSHGALREAEEQLPGFREGVERFWATGDTSHLPTEVTLPDMARGRNEKRRPCKELGRRN